MKRRLKSVLWLAVIPALSVFIYAYTTHEKEDHGNTAIITNAEGGVVNVSAKQFNQLISNGDGIILDVRTKQETDRGHIKDASFVDLNSPNFENKIDLMSRDKPIYVYCASGSRSYRAGQILVGKGFKSVYNLNGGIRAWYNAGLPITKSSNTVKDDSPEMSLEDFNKMLNTDKAVLVEFQTKWCAPCKKMVPVMNDLKNEFKNKAVIIQIDADKNRSLAKQFQIRGVPEFIVFKKKKETWRHSGLIEAQSLRKVLNGA